MEFKIGDYIKTNTDEYIVSDNGYNEISLFSLSHFTSYKMTNKYTIEEWLKGNFEIIIQHTEFRNFVLYMP